MSFRVNIKHLELEGKQFEGEIPEADLDLDLGDDLIHLAGPLRYRLWVEKHEENLLLQGNISQQFQCECARCLKSFEKEVCITDWGGFVALEGEESVEINNDMVDLTAVLREDVLLVLPQHPVCGQDCKGIHAGAGPVQQQDDKVEASDASPWDALDHLKFEKDKD